MKTDDFERQLERQPRRQLPADWRGDIIRAAQQARVESSDPAPSNWVWLGQWLWPSPRAWAGLAAAWIFLLGVGLWPVDQQSLVRENAMANSSPERLVALREQLRLQSEILQVGDAAHPIPQPPRPRTNAPLGQHAA